MAARVSKRRYRSQEFVAARGIVFESSGSACRRMQRLRVTGVLGFPHERLRSMSV